MTAPPRATSVLLIRPARAEELGRVLEVEQASFPTPWSASTFRSLLEREGVLFLVAESGDTLLGHGILWWVREEGELANVAVAPEARGRGVGARLLDALLAGAAAAGASHVFLEVRASNQPAIRLYQSRGFRDVGVRKGYYEHPREDARVMRLDLPGSSEREAPSND